MFVALAVPERKSIRSEIMKNERRCKSNFLHMQKQHGVEKTEKIEIIAVTTWPPEEPVFVTRFDVSERSVF